MSYILDALKKSENERRAGVTPGLAPAASYVVLPQHRSRHRGAALLVAVGMLGTGLALGNWRPWQEDMAGTQMPPPAPVAGAVAAPAPVATAAESPLPAKPRVSVAAKAASVVTAKTSTVVEKKRSVQPPQDRRGVASFAQPAAMPSLAVASAPAGAPKSPALSSPIAAAKPTMTAPPAAAVPAAARVALAVPMAVAAPAAVAAPVAAAPVIPVAPVPMTAATPAPAPRVVAYRELPAAVQSALPNIVFGGFAGGGEADGRIAFINNRLVREGEEVSPGLRLETVDQDGVVLGFQGHHFRTAH